MKKRQEPEEPDEQKTGGLNRRQICTCENLLYRCSRRRKKVLAAKQVLHDLIIQKVRDPVRCILPQNEVRKLIDRYTDQSGPKSDSLISIFFIYFILFPCLNHSFPFHTKNYSFIYFMCSAI